MYAALPFELRPRQFKRRRWDSNPQPAGQKTMYSNRQSVMFWWRRRFWPEAFPYGNRTRRPRCGLQTHWTELMYSEPAVAVVFNAQRRVAKRCFRHGRPYRRGEAPIVDRPLHLGETPAPLASRSPGITTLGPSCTPSRQLGNVVCVVKKAQRSGRRDIAPFGTPSLGVDVVPTGSWALI